MSANVTQTVHPELAAMGADRIEEEHRAYRARYALALARISLGWVFLWAFLDKTFGLGFATTTENAWVNGGSPTYGFLNFGTEGKVFHDFFAGLAGPVADWTFMLGLLGIGAALILGIGMRAAAASGVLLMTAMWAASLRLDNNPFMDDHLVYAIVLVALAMFGAGRTWGLGRAWEKLPLVQRHRYLI
ncbi:MAG TPA: DoxX family protein [Egibacteraceae bacterium]|nr:DoxX family protein [Egibacteraceae bacterium]